MEEVGVSFIVLCYNHEKYIDEFFECILALDYQNIHFVFTDDCSTDNSWALAIKYKDKVEKKFESARFVRNDKNKGFTDNLQECQKAAKAKYVKFMSSDDILYPSFFKDMVALMEENPDAGFGYANCKFIFDQRVKWPAESNYQGRKGYIYYGENYRHPTDRNEFISKIIVSNFIITQAALMRTEAFWDIGGVKPDYLLDDWLVWIELSLKYRVVYLNKILAMYRKHPRSLTATMAKRLKADHDAINKKYFYKVLTQYIGTDFKYAVWGASETGEKTCRFLKELFPNAVLSAVIDSSYEGDFCGVKAVTFEKFTEQNHGDYVFVATNAGNDYALGALNASGRSVLRDYITLIPINNFAKELENEK